MSAELDLVARLVAFNEGRAQPLASHLQVAIQPNALVICPIAMAGEDTTIHIVACGRIGEEPKIRCVPDPRFRDDQHALFEWLGDRVEDLFTECRDGESFPQIWVSSQAGIAHLDTLADRLRYNPRNVRVCRFGELPSYATERAPVEGQQALQAATAALCRHFATGQQPAEDEHLGTLLAWLDPSPDGNMPAAVAQAELIPMGVKTDPIFDVRLERRVRRYSSARRDGASSSSRAQRLHARRIEEELTAVVVPIYDATQRAIGILQASGLPPMPGLAEVVQREVEEFESFMQSRDDGHHLALRDGPKMAAFRLSAREDALENTEAATLRGDDVARARARLAGRIVAGMVENYHKEHLGPRRFRHRFDVVSSQPVLRVRRRDELRVLHDQRLKVTVADVQREEQQTRVSVVITAGMNKPGPPSDGASIELGPSPPDWSRLWRQRGQLSARLGTTPWTHDGGDMPDASPHPDQAPGDLLGAIEDLR